MHLQPGDRPLYIFRALVAYERRCGEMRSFINYVDDRAGFDKHIVDYHPMVKLELLAPKGKIESCGCGLFVF